MNSFQIQEQSKSFFYQMGLESIRSLLFITNTLQSLSHRIWCLCSTPKEQRHQLLLVEKQFILHPLFIKNTQKGIVEIIEDVKSLLYNKHKLTRFGLKNVNWEFNGVTDPTLTSLQPLLLSPYIEAKQINLRVNVIENRNVNQLGST